MQKKDLIIISSVSAVVLVCFILFAFLCERATSPVVIGSAVSLIPFTIALTLAARKTINYFNSPMCGFTEQIGERSKRRLHPRIRLAIFSIAGQLIMIFVIYLLYTGINGYHGTVFSMYEELFMQANPHGIGEIAHNAAERFSLIPLLPKAISLFSKPLGSRPIAAFILNSLLCSCASVALYEYLLLDNNKHTSLRAFIVLYLSPIVVYLLMPLSGASLLLLLSVSSLLAIRKNKPIAAFIFFAFNVATNAFAVLLIIPLVLSTVKLCINQHRAGETVLKPVLSASIVLTVLILLTVLFLARYFRPSALLLVYPRGFRFFFESLGICASRWITSPSTANAMFVAMAAQLLFGITMVLSAKRLDLSDSLFLLIWYMLTPLCLNLLQMSVFFLCTCPLLPSALCVSARSRRGFLIQTIIMIAALIVFVSSTFVKRLV